MVLCDIWSVHALAESNNIMYKSAGDRLCGLMVRVPSYRSRGPGSITGATRLSEK
jgi:hypothetical protein